MQQLSDRSHPVAEMDGNDLMIDQTRHMAPACRDPTPSRVGGDGSAKGECSGLVISLQ